MTSTKANDRPASVMMEAADELWWIMLLEGIAALFFGIAAIFWPGLTLLTLIYLFSAFILAWGIVEVVHGFLSIRQRDTWWLTLLFGLLAMGVGIYLVRHPQVSFTALILMIGLILIGRGILDIIGAFLENRSATHRTLSIIVGAAALAAGIILLFQPEKGGVAFVWIVGLYALVFGALTTALAIDIRNKIPPHAPSSEDRS